MKKMISVLLAAVMLLACLSGCSGSPGNNGNSSVPVENTQNVSADNTAENITNDTKTNPAGNETDNTADTSEDTAFDDGRARPSTCGKLQVINGKLCSENGEPVILRGVSLNGLVTSESFLNEQLFMELSRDIGIDLFRLPVYTYGVGSIGYCTNGDKERHKKDIDDGVELALKADMYVLIDWHILSDGDPNRYIDEAKLFFAEMAEKYSAYNNVLYEICNEPNGVDWQTVKRYAEQVIPVIREKDPDSVIIVGNPDWSKDLITVSADPLEFENIMYTLHFYSATHGQEFRDMTERLSQKGFPIFVTEFGVTAASGGHPRDLESADKWIELLEKENISYCMWAFSKVAEACSAIRSTVPKYNGFVTEDYTETGLWLLQNMEKYTSLQGAGSQP